MTQKQAAQLLQKYLEGKADLRETRLVEQWYGTLPEQPLLSHERKMLIGEEMRAHVNNAIDKKDNKQTHIFYAHWFRVAATLLVLCSIGLTTWVFNRQQHSSKLAELVVATGVNERKEIALPDGSTIILEPSSKISYPTHFSLQKRTVKLLNGDAFFEIAHEEKRPFGVQLSSELMVRVLGTSFRIRDVHQEHSVKVAVATGKVAVQHKNATIGLLVKGQELIYHRKSGNAAIQEQSQERVVKMSFEGASLAEVIKKLEYVYSIRIRVSNPLFLRLSTSADFNSAQKPSEILDIICKLHGLRFSENKNQKNFHIYK